MSGSIKSFLKSLRANGVVADGLYWISWPLFIGAKQIQSRIERHIIRNGGSAVYDGIALHFPKDVGEGFLSSISWRATDGFEPETWRVLRALIESSGTFIDVGSNIGFYSVLAKQVLDSVDVFAFEPVPALLEQNLRFHAANNIIPAVFQTALGDADGYATLFQPVESQPGESSASTLAVNSWQARKAHNEIKVQTAKLDTFFAETNLRPAVTIKIDVEDHEAAVLRGAAETIRRYRPRIVCEILPRPKRPSEPIQSESVPQQEQHGNAETAAAVDALGYVAFAITKEGLFRFSAKDFAVNRPFTDFLLLPQEQLPDNRNYFAAVRDIGLIP